MANTLDVGSLKARPGRAIPLGATVGELGVHFAIVSRHATRVWLAIFENKDDTRPAAEFELDVERNRIGDVWSVFIENLHGAPLHVAAGGPTRRRKAIVSTPNACHDPCA